MLKTLSLLNTKSEFLPVNPVLNYRHSSLLSADINEQQHVFALPDCNSDINGENDELS